jgi:hypothetical protein
MDGHYEKKFEFPFWSLIKQRAEEKDISYSDAAAEVCPEYCSTIRYRDEEYANEQITKREEEGVAEVQDSNRKVVAGSQKK